MSAYEGVPSTIETVKLLLLIGAVVVVAGVAAVFVLNVLAAPPEAVTSVHVTGGVSV